MAYWRNNHQAIGMDGAQYRRGQMVGNKNQLYRIVAEFEESITSKHIFIYPAGSRKYECGAQDQKVGLQINGNSKPCK